MTDHASKTSGSGFGRRDGDGEDPGRLVFDDTALVRRARNGDMQSFGLLVSKHQDRVFNMVRRLGPRQADAEELAQEAFLRALEHLDGFQGRSSFYTWVVRIAVNLTLSHRRRSARVKFQSADDGWELAESQARSLSDPSRTPAGPDQAVLAKERRRLVSEALDRLEVDHRVVVILRDIEQMSYEQIAEVLDLPAGTVKSRLARARSRLRELLEDVIE